MAVVTFFEKPGCRNNTRQKALLTASGHVVEARDLRQEAWTPARLRPFFGDRPVAEWFNPTAPRIKSGEVDPAALSEAEALALMVADPILIRRPLLAVAGDCRVGFEPAAIDAWIGLSAPADGDVETCVQIRPCPEPAIG